MTRQITSPLKEIHFVTGKGGVGKSTYAAFLAAQFAAQKKKTLLVEIGERSFYSYFFERTLSYKPLSIEKHLEVAHWSAAECLKSYVLSLVKVQALYRLFFENPISRSLVQVAPGLSELAIMGQITSSPRNYGPHGDHEILVVDAYATGHFLNLITTPKSMMETISVGPMGEQSRKIDDTLRIPGLCQVHIVTLAEELVLTESMELQKAIAKEFKWPIAFTLNRFLETDLKSSDLKKGGDDFRVQALYNKLYQQELTHEKLKQNLFHTLPLLASLQSFDDLKAAL